MAKIRKHAKNSAIAIALIGLGTTIVTSAEKYVEAKVSSEKSKREAFEVFFSNYQDSIECKLVNINCKK